MTAIDALRREIEAKAKEKLPSNPLADALKNGDFEVIGDKMVIRMTIRGTEIEKLEREKE